MTSINECKTLHRYKVLCECSAFVMIDFQLRRKNAKARAVACTLVSRALQLQLGLSQLWRRTHWQLHGPFYRGRFVLYRSCIMWLYVTRTTLIEPMSISVKDWWNQVFNSPDLKSDLLCVVLVFAMPKYRFLGHIALEILALLMTHSPSGYTLNSPRWIFMTRLIWGHMMKTNMGGLPIGNSLERRRNERALVYSLFRWFDFHIQIVVRVNGCRLYIVWRG